MMKAIKRILLILFLIILIAVAGIAVYSFTTHKNMFTKIIDNITKETVEDYHNGIYYYEVPLGKSYNIFSGCNVSSITTYIVVMNDTFLVYDGSCLRNKLINEGKTEDLVFSIDKETNKYQITYEDHIFKKNDKVNSIIATNKLITDYRTSSLETLDFIIDTVETEGDYFPINVRLSGVTKSYGLKFEYNENTKKFTESISQSENGLYSITFDKKEDRPLIYYTNNNLAILEKSKYIVSEENFLYRYNLVLLTRERAYDLKSEFPININDVRLDYSKNVYITKGKNNTFKLIVGNENTFCNEDKKDSDDISYYEFVIKYNFERDNFDSPELVKIGKYNEGCGYVNKYFFGG